MSLILISVTYIYSGVLPGVDNDKLLEMSIELNEAGLNISSKYSYEQKQQILTQSGYFERLKETNKRPVIDFTQKKGNTPSQEIAYRMFGPFFNWLIKNKISPFWFVLVGFGLYFGIKRTRQIQQSRSIRNFWKNLIAREKRKLYFEIFFIILNLFALIITQISMSRQI